jgi:hypothetical protein
MVATHPQGEQGAFDRLGLPIYGYVFPEGHPFLQETIDKETVWIPEGSKANTELGFPAAAVVPRSELVEAILQHTFKDAVPGREHPIILYMGGGPRRRQDKHPQKVSGTGRPGARGGSDRRR